MLTHLPLTTNSDHITDTSIVLTPSMSSVSTRCCRVPERIGSRPVCVVLGVNPTVPLPVSTSARSFCLSVLVTLTVPLLLRR